MLFEVAPKEDTGLWETIRAFSSEYAAEIQLVATIIGIIALAASLIKWQGFRRFVFWPFKKLFWLLRMVLRWLLSLRIGTVQQRERQIEAGVSRRLSGPSERVLWVAAWKNGSPFSRQVDLIVGNNSREASALHVSLETNGMNVQIVGRASWEEIPAQSQAQTTLMINEPYEFSVSSLGVHWIDESGKEDYVDLKPGPPPTVV